MEEQNRCPNCGAECPAGQKFCGTCGAKLTEEKQEQPITCTSCGFENAATQQFCGACGAKLVASKPQELDKVIVTPANVGQIEVKPTWGLAWGLYWRMLVMGLVFAGLVYLIVLVVMLTLGFTYPTGA